MKLKIKNITELLIGAWERDNKGRAWELYVSIYPNMAGDLFMPFDEFYSQDKPKEDNKSAEEILEDVKNIINTYNEGVS